MTAAQVQELIDNSMINKDVDASQEYEEIDIPNWMADMLLLLFPKWSLEKSLEFICQKFLDNNKHIKSN